jgi:hypothetical protein
VESRNLRIQLGSYTFTRVMSQFDRALPNPRTIFKEEVFEECLVPMF